MAFSLLLVFYVSLVSQVICYHICNLKRLKTLNLAAIKLNPFDENINKSNKKRTARRKVVGDSGTFPVGRVSAYCVGSSINLQALRAHVFRRGFGKSNDDYVDNNLVLSRGGVDDDGVLHISNAPLIVNMGSEQQVNSYELLDSISGDIIVDVDSEVVSKTQERVMMATQDVFYFDYGCVVFWGLSESEEKAALTELSNFSDGPVNSSELDESFDKMEYIFDKNANPQKPIRFGRVLVRSLQVAEKLALSYAMAQSSKLFVFESRVLTSVEQTRYLPQELALSGKIGINKKDINKLIGSLFVVETDVNLFSSILDTPDFLWDNDEHLSVYEYTRGYLEVDDRVALLNSRLTVIRQLLDVLTAQIADTNSTRLEWIVIWLITVEMVMGIASSPLFVGKRIVASLLVPTAMAIYLRFWKD